MYMLLNLPPSITGIINKRFYLYCQMSAFLRPLTLLSPQMSAIESVQDFLIMLEMKPCMHLVEISIFSLNHVIVRLTKIMNNLLEHLKILTFKVIFQCWKLVESFQKKSEEYWSRRPTFTKKKILKFFISKVLFFLKRCPIFVSSVHNFSMSDNDIILWNLFSLDAYTVSCPTRSKNLGRCRVDLAT